MFLLAPLQIALFHGISLTSVLANLIAVPLVTFIVVPLILTAMFLHLCAPLTIEMVIWQSADRILAALFGFLRQLPPGWLELDARWLGISLLPWPALILWRFHAWRTLPAFCLACLGLLSWPFWRSTAANEWRVTMLDVGQGLAMVIERQARPFSTIPDSPGLRVTAVSRLSSLATLASLASGRRRTQP